MTAVALLAVLSTISNVIDNPLVKRLLQNISKRTTNTVDDWVVGALYGASKLVAAATKEPAVPPAEAALAKVQERYDSLTPEQKAEATKPVNSPVIPGIEVNVPDFS